MNYPMFALLAIMFLAYVFLKRTNKHKRRNSSAEQDQRIRQLEEEINRLKDKDL